MKEPVPAEIQVWIDQGKDVKAIKAAREAFGYSLLEAKQYVDGVKMKLE